MYYFDCACGHDRFQEFSDLQKAKAAYEEMPCREKILYEENDGKFTTILERKK